MSRSLLRYDWFSGKLEQGHVWSFDLTLHRLLEAHPGLVYARLTDFKDRELFGCPVDTSHVTDSVFVMIRLELFGGSNLEEFVPVDEMPLCVVTEEFANRLATSGLTGYVLRSIIDVGSNQSNVPDPHLCYLDFAGRGGSSYHRWNMLNGPNLCPHCHRVPMVCPGCGEMNWPRCAYCGELTLYRPDALEYSHVQGIALEGGDPSHRGFIVEAKDWDGSDFFRVSRAPFVSERAREWLEGVGAKPVAFEPALLNVEVAR